MKRQGFDQISSYVALMGGDACLSSPCQNGGSCFRGAAGGFACLCASGFIGTQCTAGEFWVIWLEVVVFDLGHCPFCFLNVQYHMNTCKLG